MIEQAAGWVLMYLTVGCIIKSLRGDPSQRIIFTWPRILWEKRDGQ